MDPTTIDPLSAAFAALADPTRRAILARLAQGDSSVGELVKPFPISAPAISRHLRVLESASLIERKVDAQWRICRLNPPGLRVAADWLSQYRDFWENSLDRLVEALEHDQAGPSSTLEKSQAASAPAPPANPLRKPRGHARARINPSNHKRRSP